MQLVWYSCCPCVRIFAIKKAEMVKNILNKKVFITSILVANIFITSIIIFIL